jgi:hypothetical protein
LGVGGGSARRVVLLPPSPTLQSLPSLAPRYILRRYSGGEDKEEAQKVHRVMTEEEWEKVRKQVGEREVGGTREARGFLDCPWFLPPC